MYFTNKKINVYLITGIFLSTIGGGIGIFIPLQLKNIIDKKSILGINNGLISIILLGMLFILQAVVTAGGMYLTSIAGEKYINYFRKKLFNHILKLPVGFFDNYKSGEISGRIVNDTATIREFLTESLPSFVSSIVIFFGSIFMLFTLDIKLSFLLICTLPLLLIIVLPLSSLTGKYSKLKQSYLSEVIGSMSEYIGQIRLIKSNRAEKKISQKENKEIDYVYKTSIKADLINSLINPVVFLFLFGVVAIIFGYGGIRVQNDTLTVGTLVSFLVYLFQMLNPISYLANFSNRYTEMKGATKKLKEYTNINTEFKSNNNNKFFNIINNVPMNVKVNNVDFSYGKHEIFKNLNMVFNAGEKTAIVGPSGSGKTTILNLIERFYIPNKGLIFIGDLDSNNCDLLKWRSFISLVLQDSSIISGTVKDNLLLGLDYIPSKKQINDALDKSYLSEKINSLPQGINTFVGERGIKLSGGEKQRLQIARIFLQNPSILMLDEATSSLDSDSEKVVSKALDNISSKTTMIVVAHRLSTIIDSQKIYFVDHGKISGVGTHEELLKSHKKYYKYVQEQFIDKK